MSALMKKHHTKSHTNSGVILHMMHEGHIYNIPN